MAVIRKTIRWDDPVSPEDMARRAAVTDWPVDTSDIPELTPEELQKLGRQMREKRKKVMFSLRLQKCSIEWWQTYVGKGYTAIMARLLEEAPYHPEWIKQCLAVPVLYQKQNPL